MVSWHAFFSTSFSILYPSGKDGGANILLETLSSICQEFGRHSFLSCGVHQIVDHNLVIGVAIKVRI